MSATTSIRVALDASVVAQIEAQPDFVPPTRGRASGVAHWVRQLVLRELGEEYRDPHELQSRKFASQKKKGEV